jgi:hypothetical protein
VSVAEQPELGLDAELWVPVVYRGEAIEPYEVSSLGRIRNAKSGRVLRLCEAVTGQACKSQRYWKVGLYKSRKRITIRVHALVLEGFVGPRPHGRQAAHWNGDGQDNRLCNLRWATPLQNRVDGERHGTQKAYAHEDYERAIRLRRLGWSLRQVARAIGCTNQTVSRWERGERLPWR